MDKFSNTIIWDWTEANQFAQRLLMSNKFHNMCSFSLSTDRNGNLTDKGWNELLKIFQDRDYTISYFTEHWRPNISDSKSRLDEKEKLALSEILTKCYKLYEERNMNFAYSLLNNYIKVYHSFPTGEESQYEDDEVEECNRQFRSMMDDNDAWGNIE